MNLFQLQVVHPQLGASSREKIAAPQSHEAIAEDSYHASCRGVYKTLALLPHLFERHPPTPSPPHIPVTIQLS